MGHQTHLLFMCRITGVPLLQAVQSPYAARSMTHEVRAQTFRSEGA